MKNEFYQIAIQAAPFGICCLRVISNEENQPCNFILLEYNRAFAETMKFKDGKWEGASLTELSTQYRDVVKDWCKLYQDIYALEGTKEREMERYTQDLGGWYRVKASVPEEDMMIVYLMGCDIDANQTTGLRRAAEAYIASERMEASGTEHFNLLEKRLTEIAEVLKLENDQQFRRIIEHLPFSLNIMTVEGKLLYANPKFFDMFELQEDAIGGDSLLNNWVEPKKRRRWVNALKRKGVVNDFELHLKNASGREFWAIASGILILYQEQLSILSTIIDITERKRMESALKTNEEKYRLLTEHASDVIWVYNLKKNRYTYVSPSIYYLTGFTVEKSMKMRLEDMLTQESISIFQNLLDQHLRSFGNDPEKPRTFITEVRQKCQDGGVIWVEISSKFRLNEKREVELVGVSRNAEERKRAEREVIYLSYHDQLTGLYNRRFYEEELVRMNFNWNMPITLVLGDVNGLKLTNDAFGHLTGDRLLRRFSNILKKQMRAEDVAARIGGDEFIILLPKTDAIGAEIMVNRIKDRIEKHDGEDGVLSVSFGWATKIDVEEDFNGIFIQAEDRMYQKKLLESASMKNQTIRLAMDKLFMKSFVEEPHAIRVGELCRTIGGEMGLTGIFLDELELLGRMHDIGKVGISKDILVKQGPLSDTEWLELKRHPEIGYQILKTVDDYVRIAEAVLSHHERMDGQGYPRNLEAKEIPLQSKILAVAEAFDYMTRENHDGRLMSEKESVEELYKKAGSQFDADVVDVLAKQVLPKF